MIQKVTRSISGEITNILKHCYGNNIDTHTKNHRVSKVNYIQNGESSITLNSQQRYLKEKEIANRYDVTNISPNEKVALAKELYDSGFIDIKMMLMLSFDLSLGEDKHKLTGRSPDTKVNALNIYKQELEFALKHGDTKEGIQQRESIISLLENLNDIR